MDAGPLCCISSVAIPSSPGAFPHFCIPTSCSNSASNGSGSDLVDSVLIMNCPSHNTLAYQ